ncbi:MAG: alpha/beta fold hydrolase, partial [Alphaproteobacteria bacterium]|nr:alpha/beta fold hydrolase [Alphaproteobacteria bacterium]
MDGTRIADGVAERMVAVAGAELRVWEKGRGAPIIVLPGFGGAARWTAFMEALAATRRVVVPSLPGFPGGARAHERLDTHLDWILAARDLATAAAGADVREFDLVGISVGGALAAEIAALWPPLVRRLILVAPFGLCDDRAPPFDVFAVKPGTGGDHLCADPKRFAAHIVAPEGADALEWDIGIVRANEAAARILWPLGDTGLAKRLSRIVAPTL